MPTTGWPRTVLIVIAGAMLASGAFAVTWAGLFRDAQPALALSVAPWDAGARISLAGQVIVSNPSSVGLSSAQALAMEAAKRQALSAANIRTLAVIMDARGDRADALRVMLASERLSRRDLLAQLWLIEHFSGTDDVARVLVNYDRALTASHDSLPILFPVLIAASTDPNLATPLVRFLDRTRARSWHSILIGEMATRSADPAATGRVVGAVLRPNEPKDRGLFVTLIERNISVRKFDEAFALYARATGTAPDPRRAAILRDGDFPEVGTYPPFDWQQADAGPLATERRPRPDGAGSALFVRGDDIGDGVVARQLVKLTGDIYLASFESGAGEAGGFRLALACADQGGTPSWTNVDMQTSSQGQRASGRFAALTGCRWHWLALRIVPGALVSGQEPWIGSVKLAEANGEGNQ